MIIQGLELRLGADEQTRLKSDAPVNNLAYEYYLRGRGFVFGLELCCSDSNVGKICGYRPQLRTYLGTHGAALHD